MKNFFRKNKSVWWGLALLAGVVWINRFPAGYIFAGGDTAQYLIDTEGFWKIFYATEGRLSLFYGLIQLLKMIGLSDAGELSCYLVLFLGGSFLSFLFFARTFFPRQEKRAQTLVALFYTLNLFTLFVFTGNWGFSYYLFLYVFLPALMTLLIKFLKAGKFVFAGCFGCLLFLNSSGFGNPAFALSFLLFSFFLVLGLAGVGYLKINRELFFNLFKILLISFLVSFWWLMPLAPQMKSRVEGLNNSTVLKLEEVLRNKSGPIRDTLSLAHRSENYFPYAFYYRNWRDWKEFFVALSFLPIILILASFVWGKGKNGKKEQCFWLAWFFTLAIFVVLVARIRPPFEAINDFVYHLWGFSTLRHVEKTLIFIPFLLAGLLLLAEQKSRSKKWFEAGMILILLVPLPFYVGKLQQTAGYRVSTNRPYQTAKNSFLLKIPEEYYQIQEILNGDKEKFFVATLPETKSDGSGIVHYPAWELFGVDVTRFLYRADFINANGWHFPGWNFAGDFSQTAGDAQWLIKLLGMMNAKYIIYHKDASEKYVEATKDKMEELEKAGLIENIEENQYFALYQIDKQLILPYVSFQSKNFEIEGTSESIENNFEALRGDVREVSFEEINPKKYEVVLEKNTNINYRINSSIVLAETYDPLWRAYAVDAKGKERRLDNHFRARGYANGWELENVENAEKIIIEYYPTRLMWRGMAVSGMVVLGLFGWLVKWYYEERKACKVEKGG